MKAKQRNRPVTSDDINRLKRAEEDLRIVVRECRLAGAGNAANYVARALKSVTGATNSAYRMYYKQRAKFNGYDTQDEANEAAAQVIENMNGSPHA